MQEELRARRQSLWRMAERVEGEKEREGGREREDRLHDQGEKGGRTGTAVVCSLYNSIGREIIVLKRLSFRGIACLASVSSRRRCEFHR